MKLLFVYNANSGKLNALFDSGHKLFNPSTYRCSLCNLTHDIFTENSLWKSFKAKTDLDMKFYHKDEFEEEFPSINILYPSVLKLESNQLTIILNNEALNEISNTQELIQRLQSNL